MPEELISTQDSTGLTKIIWAIEQEWKWDLGSKDSTLPD